MPSLSSLFRPIFRPNRRFIHLLIQPFCFLHLRYVQWLYKKLTLMYINDMHNKNSRYSTKLRLLQAKEEYYKSCYDCYGIFYPSCCYTVKHEKRMKWLFPTKKFKELVDVKWYSEEAVDFYRRVIVYNNIPMPIWNDAWNKNGRNAPDVYDFSTFNFEHHHRYAISYKETMKRKNKA